MQQKLKKRMNKGALAALMSAAAVLMATSVWADKPLGERRGYNIINNTPIKGVQSESGQCSKEAIFPAHVLPGTSNQPYYNQINIPASSPSGPAVRDCTVTYSFVQQSKVSMQTFNCTMSIRDELNNDDWVLSVDRADGQICEAVDGGHQIEINSPGP